jgi:hypothetical protein
MCRDVLLCEDVLLRATMCLYVRLHMSYCELKSETMCYYALLCATICNYV